MSVLKFKCRCCNSYHDIKRTVPTGFSGWSYPGMEWSDFTDEVPPLTQERWRITEEVKKIGSNNIPKSIPHKDCATDASSNFSSDETKSGVNTCCIHEHFCEIRRKICKQMACKVARCSLCGVALMSVVYAR